MQAEKALQKRFNKKEWSWIMYDWANSIYATNIMAAIYPTIFASMVEGGDIHWGYATSAATLVVAILAPVLGALADYKGMKKKLFTIFMLMGVIFTPLMAIFGSWKIALIGYVVSRIGFSGSCLFYDSFLTDVTTTERMDKVSSWGYAMGYIGGSTIPFVISIAVLLIFGYENTFAQTFSVLIVSLWWIVFSIPLLKHVEQEHYIEKPEKFSVKAVFANVWTTFKKISTNKGLLIFILAYFFYIDGVGTIISISTAYGTTLGLGTVGMIIALLVTQLVAMPCSIIFAKLSEKHSARKALIGAVIIYLGVTIVGFFMGYHIEPSQKAYEDELKAAYNTITVTEHKSEAEAFRDKVIQKLESDDIAAAFEAIDKADFEMIKGSDDENVKALETQIKDTLKAAYQANTAKYDAFRDKIGLSSLLFWIMAVLVGTVQGGIQAVSRSYFGKLIPKHRSNEYYGFFDIFGKFAAVIGPLIYSTIGDLIGWRCVGVLGLSLMFLIGLVLLIIGKKSMEADEIQQAH